MKTIKIQAIDPDDNGVRQNEVMVSRIVGWYSRGWNYFNPKSPDSEGYSDYSGPITIVSLDSGAEYSIAESLESFRTRLRAIIDVPSYGFTGFKPMPPFVPKIKDPCVRCGESVSGRGTALTVMRDNAAPAVFEIIAHPCFGVGEKLCGHCVRRLVSEQFALEMKGKEN